jgi:NAD(P)H-hydrate epimerase
MTTELYLSRQQSREVDQRAIDEYGMLGVVLMENAGRGCVDTLCALGIDGPVVVCCGSGNNAGDGFVIARHLDLRGYSTRVLLWSSPQKLRGDADHNFQILLRSGVPIIDCVGRGEAEFLEPHLAGADWIVDALLGTGAFGEPRPPLDRVIPLLNGRPARRLAVDVPSGLDCDTGQPAQRTFRADHTCTFVARKAGFRGEAAGVFLGQIHVLDIGAPRQLIETQSRR